MSNSSLLCGGLGKGKEFDAIQKLKQEYERKYHYSLENKEAMAAALSMESDKVRTRRQLMQDFLKTTAI